jgi:hypothetical protein
MLPSFEEVAYMALKLGLLGSNISRSRMPRLQKHLGKLQGIAIDYVLLDDPGLSVLSPRDQIQKARAEGFHGLNVTHPYKQQIHPLVSSAYMKGHERIGSYNTLLLGKDGLQWLQEGISKDQGKRGTRASTALWCRWRRQGCCHRPCRPWLQINAGV